jgi:ATP-dependent RNA helicase SUPV3L1/SUV3
LYSLESLHKMLVCYLWLSYRFPNVFTTRTLANYTKKLVEDQIEKTLKEFSFIQEARLKMQKQRKEAWSSIQSEPADAEEGNEDATKEVEVKPSLIRRVGAGQEGVRPRL